MVLLPKGKMHMPNADKVLEAEYTEAEMAAVVRLGAKWIEWQQLFPYATGSGINRLAKIVIAVDKHVDGIEDLTVARSHAVEKINHLLDEDALSPEDEEHRKEGLRLLKKEKVQPSQTAYLLRTVQLFADDFPSWMKEVGLGGFLQSLIAFCKVYGETYDSVLDDKKVPKSSKQFMTAFEMRAKFGKADMELDAIKFLTDEGLVPA